MKHYTVCPRRFWFPVLHERGPLFDREDFAIVSWIVVAATVSYWIGRGVLTWIA